MLPDILSVSGVETARLHWIVPRCIFGKRRVQIIKVGPVVLKKYKRYVVVMKRVE
jgi:hypothetical protein